MDWQKGGSSDNVEVDSGTGGGGGGGGFGGGRMGLGGLIVLAILGWVFFKNPLALLDQGGVQSNVPAQSAPVQIDPQQKAFVSAILHSTEQTWGEIFQAKGMTYVDPKLHLFTGGVRTACGGATTAVGPFYCPGDQKVYLDVAFFQQLQDQLHSSGDFARAYVIGHEVGHHVQKLTGVFDKVQQMQRQGQPMDGADGLSVRQELQADCYAGVWANHSQKDLNWLQPGDIESALNAASHIGDDTLQQQAQGRVRPDTFTHGTSAQRVKWFKTGFSSGDMDQCDTFAGEP
ncbi:neutral zinc metallopeptidase [Rhodanobacter sp. B04]|uniref:KPN_02809 family neutral zinc metallopeptidase n=1 Tax=Rhodanobacter sp. B04 TaxID=1945860 RepID=UPI000987918A|nr:neutral zinc metallopeptidase [Rhodanobacter sp. B04]OOG64977.1 neutral zinc metallopeptidase [Rhodanobacter sp. B04]